MLSKSHLIVPEFSKAPHPFELYLPAKSNRPVPIIFQTPILGRFAALPDLFFESHFARYFAAHGFACALIHRPIFNFNSSLGLEQIPKYIEDSLARNQRIFDALKKDSRLDFTKTATFGMSFGAVINSLWASQQKDLQAHVFCLGGGNLAEIFMSSKDPLMKSYREAALAACSGNANLLKNNLQKLFTLDPLTCSSLPEASKVLLVLGIFDQVIPYRFAKELKSKLGSPRTITLPFGHYFSLLAVPFIKPAVVHFFRKRL